jgi:NAD(P)-dependent dehydrogenase (short-subunit alcohol dehydrogenase family)
MREQGSGKIITVASQAGPRSNKDDDHAHYGVAKAGIVT